MCCTRAGAPALQPGEASRESGEKRNPVPDYILIPLLLVLMSVGLVALIYWGSFVEERRNRNRA
jgi:hypothetical protein